MSKNPEKYGVQIVNIDTLRGSHDWKHDTMTVTEAEQILTGVNNKINDLRPRNKNNYFVKFADLPEDADDKIPQLLKDSIRVKGRQYIENKFKGRAIS